MTPVIGYQGCPPLNEKLLNQPNKIVVFLLMLLCSWEDFFNLSTSLNMEKLKFT
jgi:hypothetical protein